MKFNLGQSVGLYRSVGYQSAEDVGPMVRIGDGLNLELWSFLSRRLMGPNPSLARLLNPALESA